MRILDIHLKAIIVAYLSEVMAGINSGKWKSDPNPFLKLSFPPSRPKHPFTQHDYGSERWYHREATSLLKPS